MTSKEHPSATRGESVDDVRSLYQPYLALYSGAIFASGLIAREEKLADTGFLAFESIFWARQVSGLTKELTRRERPRTAQHPFQFRGPGGETGDGTSAFVSLDTITAFAFAASVSNVWKKTWLTATLYSLATVVALHRIDVHAHWLSDVVGAGIVGHAIGRRIVRFHYPESEDGRRSAFEYSVQPLVSQDLVGVSTVIRF